MTLNENANLTQALPLRPAWGALAAALLICAAFGWWFAKQQVAVLDAQALYPPLRLMLGTGVVVTLVALIPYIYCSVYIGTAPLPLIRWLPLLGLLPLLMVFTGFRAPMALRISLLAFLILCLAAFSLRRARSQERTSDNHWLAFAAILLTQFFFNGYFSPLSLHLTPFHIPGLFSPQLSVMMQIFRSFIWIKEFSLSSLDYSYWLIGPHTPISHASPAMQLLSMLTDSPSMDITAFYRMLHWLYFALCVCGSFGFYLLLSTGLRLGWSLSTAFGMLYTFVQEGLGMSSLMPDIVDGISTQAVFPYAVCFMFYALRENKIFSAVLSGGAIAASYILLPPHFEVLLYMLLCFGILSVAAAWTVTAQVDWKKCFLMFSCSAISFASISAFYLAPILIAQWNGDLVTQGHTDLSKLGLFAKMKLDVYPTVFIFIVAGIMSAHFLFKKRKDRKESIFPAAVLALMILLWPVHSPLLIIATSILHSEPNFDPTLYGRRFYFICFCALMLVAMALDKSNLQDSAASVLKSDLVMSLSDSLRAPNIAILIVAVLACALLQLRPQTRLTNPQQCPYYVMLEAELANYDLLKGDPSNTELIRSRLAGFERDVRAHTATNYIREYELLLKQYSINASNDLHSAAGIYGFARTAAPLIDRFYTDAAYNCVHPAEGKYEGYDKIFLLPNLASLYSSPTQPFVKLAGFAAYDALPHLVSGVDTGSIFMGTSPGLFVHNAGGSFDSRFMIGAPLAQVLYLLPGNDFMSLGTYRRLNRNWELSPELLFNRFYRKLFDIAGFDMVLVPQQRAKAFASVAGFEPVERDHPPALSAFNDIMLLRNKQSYGIAYLANKIQYMPESKVMPLEHTLWQYLTRHNENASEFHEARTWLYEQLADLKDKYDILLEAPERANRSVPAGNVAIQNILGEATVMNADCRREECELVYNLIKLPGWHAYADGKPLPISRANFAFLAVPLSRGRHEVWFIYTPTGFLWFTLLSLISLLLWPLLPRR